MPIVFTSADLVASLQTLIDGRLSSETMCLWSGSHTPSLGDTTFFYLVHESIFPGYRRVPIVWTAAASSSESISLTMGELAEWSPSSDPLAPVVVAGVFALDSELQVAWAELLPQGSETLSAAGHVVTYQPFISMGETGRQ